MDFLLSLVVPKKMQRYKNMSGIVAVALFAICAYILCLPIKIKSANVDNLIEQNGYHSAEFVNFTTAHDISEIKAFSPKLDNYNLVCSDEDNHTFTLVDDGKTIYLVFAPSYDEFSTSLDLYELFSLEKKNNTFALLFAKEFFYLDHIDEDGKLEVVQGADYKYMDLDFANCETTNELIHYVGYNLATLYGQVLSASFAISAILMVIILPLILTVVMFLLLRKRSKMTKFSEYMNISAICSIAPTIVFFIVGFFFTSFINFYTTVFVIYYIFTAYKINTLSQ